MKIGRSVGLLADRLTRRRADVISCASAEIYCTRHTLIRIEYTIQYVAFRLYSYKLIRYIIVVCTYS